MKKNFFSAFAIFFALSVPSFAYDDDPFAAAHKSLKDQAFVIETDEESSAESLNRISGNIDLGFTLPDQEYESSSHSLPGPFGREETKDKASLASQSY